MFALITTDKVYNGYKIAQVSSTKFEVVSRMKWVPCSSDINETEFYYTNTNEFKRIPIEEVTLPQPTVPEAVSMRQARLALLQVGKYDLAMEAVSTLDIAARIEWEFSTTVRRDSPLVIAMSEKLGLSSSDTDSLFNLAATL